MNPTTAQLSDDIDGLLTAFFRSEAPAPWPPLKAPVTTPRPSRGSTRNSAGRWALAASVAALLAGGWYLSGRLPGSVPGAPSLDTGSATVRPELRPGPQPTPRHP
jgi:hypothetical protein